MATINRTKLELKLDHIAGINAFRYTINRTKLELKLTINDNDFIFVKFYQSYQTGIETDRLKSSVNELVDLSIVPNWN